MNAAQVVQGVTALGLDTAPIIYFVEKVPAYFAVCEPFFAAIDEGRVTAFTSTLTLPETLAHPLRFGNYEYANKFRNLLLATTGFATIEVSSTLAERAADLRARYNLRTPDAIQAATALEMGCDAFLTNDTALKRITELRVILVSELIL